MTTTDDNALRAAVRRLEALLPFVLGNSFLVRRGRAGDSLEVQLGQADAGALALVLARVRETMPEAP